MERERYTASQMEANEAHQLGHEDERAAVVKWLRRIQEGDDSHNHWSYIANRIERGDHLKD